MSVEQTLNKMESSLNNMIENIKKNEYATMGIAVVLIVFAALVAPRLPGTVIGLFDNSIVKLLIFLIVAFAAKKNPTIGIVLAVCLMVVLHISSQRKIEKKINDVVMQAKRENMTAEISAMQNQDMQIMQNMGHPPQNLGQQQVAPTVMMQPEAAQQIMNETKPAPIGQCESKMSYKNQNYHQYIDLDPSSYNARSNLINGVGYDDTCDSNEGYLESNVTDTIGAFSKTCGYSSI
jgi:hypothetical protein